jgi:hypothetical protein
MDIVGRRHLVLVDADGLGFVWPDAAVAATWTTYRLPESEAGVRLIDEIPLEEIAALGREVSAADRAVEIARRFGIRRVTSGARMRIETACASASRGGGFWA